jgi:hypothetical protein
VAFVRRRECVRINGPMHYSDLYTLEAARYRKGAFGFTVISQIYLIQFQMFWDEDLTRARQHA